MATLAIKGSVTRCEDIAKLFITLGAKEFLCDLIDEKLLYCIDHDKNVISIPDQPDNIYRKLLFNIYTIEEFEAKFPYRVGDKVTFDVYYSVEEPCKKVTSSIERMLWSDDPNEVVYIMENGVMRFMRELSMPEPKFEPKDGDVVATRNGKYIHICKAYIEDYAINTYIGCTLEGELLEGGRWYASRPATGEEMKKLFDKLKENGLAWDAEKRELVKLKWKPNLEDTYWYPSSNTPYFNPFYFTWTDSDFDRARFESGWCFRTEEECQAFCDKLNQVIEGVKP